MEQCSFYEDMKSRVISDIIDQADAGYLFNIEFGGEVEFNEGQFEKNLNKLKDSVNSKEYFEILLEEVFCDFEFVSSKNLYFDILIESQSKLGVGEWVGFTCPFIDGVIEDAESFLIDSSEESPFYKEDSQDIFAENFNYDFSTFKFFMELTREIHLLLRDKRDSA